MRVEAPSAEDKSGREIKRYAGRGREPIVSNTKKKLGIISESRSHSDVGKTTNISVMADVGLKLLLKVNALLPFSFPGKNTVYCLDS